MAIVVLFSTMSFTIDMHYCGDTLVDTAIFNKVDTCGMETENPATNACAVIKDNCCSNEQIAMDGQDELKTSFDSLSKDQQILTATFIYAYINLFEGFDENTIAYSEYPPPPLVKAIYKLDETYLI